MLAPELLLGVDIGGTFTDLILFDPNSKKMWFKKVLTTPKDFSQGVIEGIESIIESTTAFSTENIFSVIHGNTIGINTVIERKGAKTGLITTKGFEDVLLIGRQTRPKLYDWNVGRPAPLVPGNLRKGLYERINHRGEVLIPVDINEISEVLEHFKLNQVKSIAVCLLHSYADLTHESLVKKTIENEAVENFVSISSELLPEYREYERMSTTVINSYIGPIISKYLASMDIKLSKSGVKQFLIMKADGSLSRIEDATKYPVRTIESGPAGGVMAAAYIGELTGRNNIVSFDMGGTTAKCSIVKNSEPLITTTYEVSPVEQKEKLLRGSGYPIMTPVIDLVEVGAGGGSIAWIDSGGALRVGPKSAGAEPGPICYNRGGKDVTITDANLVLGRLNPDYFLGGELQLDYLTTDQALKEFAETIGLSKIEAAEGILDVANAVMARGIKFVTTERGIDIDNYSLVAFGGAAPVQIVDLAEIVGIREIIIPPSPGVFSAFGFLVANTAHNYVKTSYSVSSETHLDEVEKIFSELEDKGRIQLEEDNVLPSDMTFKRFIDMRYIGQSHELRVEVSGVQNLREIVNKFHIIHDQHHGYSMQDEELALVNYRLLASGNRKKPRLEKFERNINEVALIPKYEKLVHFKDQDWIRCNVFERELLRPSNLVRGPCIIEEWDTTLVINIGYSGRIDQYGNIILKKEEPLDEF
jgi:N-methylhydantoinase A